MLRDAHQSLLATRMRTEDMLPIAAKLNRAGYWSVEMWGGATFDSMMRFLNEDPWERVRALKATMPDTRLQMLLRGQNVVGYRNYADDVVREFVRLAAWAGIDVFRVFDALNDPRNLETAIAAVKDSGKWVEGTISYTKSPVHNVGSFLDYAARLAELGAQSFCIKDMAGLLDPQDAYELVSALKAAHPDILVHMHCHYTSGMASMAYLKAVEAGADILDCAISSMSMGTSHPPTESMVAALAGTERATGMDIGVLEEISEYFRDVRKKYRAYESAFTAVDPAVLLWQIPGGMISNLSSQLKDQGALERMEEVLAEVPRVRQELGYPPLVTPTSQIVGTQATLNVLMGRYQMVTKETKAYVQGFYGRPPGAGRPRGAEAHHRRREAHHRRDRPTCWSRSCPSAGPNSTSWASPTPTKTSCRTRCSRRWPWSSSPGATGRNGLARSWRPWSRPWPTCWAWNARKCARLRPKRPWGRRTVMAADPGYRRTSGAVTGLPQPAGPATGSAWAAAGRAELVAARAVAWRY